MKEKQKNEKVQNLKRMVAEIDAKIEVLKKQRELYLLKISQTEKLEK